MAELTLKDLKDLLDDDELDLSARGLTTIPKALYQLPKARRIDLSGNKLSVLPKELCNMTRITSLDLAGNKLVVLPDCIGNLVNLEHLNMFNNRIEADLPLSFAGLRSLKWLDLKRNSLLPDLQAAVGNCGTDKECRTAAVSVMQYIQTVKNSVQEQVKKQEKVLQKVKSVKAEQKNQKLKDAQKKITGAAIESNKNGVEPKMAKGNKSKGHSQSAPAAKSSVRKSGSFLGNGVALLVASTVKIASGCSGYSSEVQGSKALCKDLASLVHMTKPSPQFVANAKGTYAVVFTDYHNAVKYHWATLSSKSKQYWKQFTKSSVGKSIETTFYKVHAFVVEKALLVQKFAVQQWAAFETWYAKDGKALLGQTVENVKVIGGVVFEMVKDVANFASDCASTAYHRIEEFILVWQENGFAKAVERIST